MKQRLTYCLILTALFVIGVTIHSCINANANEPDDPFGDVATMETLTAAVKDLTAKVDSLEKLYKPLPSLEGTTWRCNKGHYNGSYLRFASNSVVYSWSYDGKSMETYTLEYTYDMENAVLTIANGHSSFHVYTGKHPHLMVNFETGFVLLELVQ